MLVRFTVENFLSFKDETVFSMIAGKAHKHRDHIVSSGKRSDFRLLKTAVIYGPNAAGKTNLIRAMDFARDLITGRMITRPTQSIPVIPFLLDKSAEESPTRFAFDIKCEEKYYTYGFSIDTQRVHSEWLREIRPNSEKLIFERHTDKDGNANIRFGSFQLSEDHSLDFLSFTASGTRPNQLFLTESVERNIRYFQTVYDWFDRRLVLIYPDTRPTGIHFGTNIDAAFQTKLGKLMNVFDVGIQGVELEEIDFDKDTRFPTEFKEFIRKTILELPRPTAVQGSVQLHDTTLLFDVDEEIEITSIKFQTIHRVDHEDRDVVFDMAQESAGTQRLFSLSPTILEFLSGESDRVYVVDELDRKLHSRLSYSIVQMYLQNSGQEPNQFIVTTHESGLLDLDLLRRDEIWFVEKNSEGKSSMYSLEDFVPRADSGIRKRYLKGRYGAIPIVLSVSNLEWAK